MVKAGDWDDGQGRQGGGEGVRIMEAGKGSKGHSDRTPLGLTGTWSQGEDDKEEAIGLGKSVTGLHEELLGPPRIGGNCRQAVETRRWGLCTVRWLLCSQERWGKRSGYKERYKWCRWVKYG